MSETLTLTEVRGDLVLAALCVGQFHAPCQIEADRLIVQPSDALLQALQALGLSLSTTVAIFTPAPFFAPEAGRSEAHRHVRTHVSRSHDEEASDEITAPASNA